MAVLLYKSRSASSRIDADEARERAGIPTDAEFIGRPDGESVIDACGRAAGACAGPALDLAEEILTVTSVRRSVTLAPEELAPPRF